jgi:phosphoribosylamine--glycine ligase
MRAKAAGHQVRMYLATYDPVKRPIGKGLIDLITDYRLAVDWADLVILESNGKYMLEAELWRRRGKAVIGGTPESAAWELDREQGMRVFRKAGIPIPPFRVFTDYAEAIAFVERKGEPFYSKPCSDTADKSLSAKTGVAEDPAWMLRKWKKKHGRPPCPFLLQESIAGVEFAVGAWFGPSGFADGFEENFEHKKVHAGDLGPNCGEAGTVMRYVKRSKLADKVLKPIEEQLARLDYVGNVDVNCIVDEDGHPWPLEFTMRFGWPAFNIELSLIDVDPIEYFMALAEGGDARGAHVMNRVACGVVLALPPYPNPPRDYEDIVGVPLYGEIGNHWHPCEIQGGDQGGEIVSAGGYVGVVTGVGDSVREAAKGAYRALDKIHMPASPFWRNDIGKRLSHDIPGLQEHGFAAGMVY